MPMTINHLVSLDVVEHLSTQESEDLAVAIRSPWRQFATHSHIHEKLAEWNRHKHRVVCDCAENVVMAIVEKDEEPNTGAFYLRRLKASNLHDPECAFHRALTSTKEPNPEESPEAPHFVLSAGLEFEPEGDSACRQVAIAILESPALDTRLANSQTKTGLSMKGEGSSWEAMEKAIADVVPKVALPAIKVGRHPGAIARCMEIKSAHQESPIGPTAFGISVFYANEIDGNNVRLHAGKRIESTEFKGITWLGGNLSQAKNIGYLVVGHFSAEGSERQFVEPREAFVIPILSFNAPLPIVAIPHLKILRAIRKGVAAMLPAPAHLKPIVMMNATKGCTKAYKVEAAQGSVVFCLGDDKAKLLERLRTERIKGISRVALNDQSYIRAINDEIQTLAQSGIQR